LSLSKDEDGLVKTGQAPGTYAAAVDEGSSHGHDQQSFGGSQSQALVAGHHEGRGEQIMEVSSENTEENRRKTY
jgi:hypothetical protein